MVVGAIRSMVNARRLYLQCARVLYESSLIPVLTYDNKTIIWREEDRSRIRVVPQRSAGHQENG